jgi:hypothetical protein
MRKIICLRHRFLAETRIVLAAASSDWLCKHPAFARLMTEAISWRVKQKERETKHPRSSAEIKSEWSIILVRFFSKLLHLCVCVCVCVYTDIYIYIYVT